MTRVSLSDWVSHGRSGSGGNFDKEGDEFNFSFFLSLGILIHCSRGCVIVFDSFKFYFVYFCIFDMDGDIYLYILILH